MLSALAALPGQLDFARMRSVAGLPEGAPIFATVAALATAAERAAAWEAIASVEAEAFTSSALQLQPGLSELVQKLRAAGIRLGVATRNNAASVAALLRIAGLPADTFDPILTRDSGFADKPDPAIALAACAAWGVPPASCLMVGDSLDDVTCGHAAGMATCRLRPPPEAAAQAVDGAVDGAPAAEEADFAIAALAELTAMVDDAAARE